MGRTALDRAERLFALGRFAELISLLEPQVPVYRESQRFYYLLGSSCLRSGDSGGAATYLKRAEQLSPSSVDIMLALAALSVRRGDTERAVEYYLRALEEKPGDRKAAFGLSVLRKEGGQEGLARLSESGRIEALYPGGRPIPRYLPPAAIVLAAVALIYFGWPLGRSLFEVVSRPRVARPEVASVSLSKAEIEAPILSGGSFRYALTEKQALRSFELAKDYFQAYRDNAAIIEINRLSMSNANPAIKEKARSLRAFVGKPDFRTVKDAPSYSVAQRDPALYDGCSVVWKGLAANVRPEAAARPGGRTESATIDFDFLVGYQDKKKLEGLVPARIAGVEVPVDRPLEILATLSSADGTIRMECAAIHELAQASSP
jgi:tetratricopeptide (TPR) repeat protein